MSAFPARPASRTSFHFQTRRIYPSAPLPSWAGPDTDHPVLPRPHPAVTRLSASSAIAKRRPNVQEQELPQHQSAFSPSKPEAGSPQSFYARFARGSLHMQQGKSERHRSKLPGRHIHVHFERGASDGRCPYQHQGSTGRAVDPLDSPRIRTSDAPHIADPGPLFISAHARESERSPAASDPSYSRCRRQMRRDTCN